MEKECCKDCTNFKLKVNGHDMGMCLIKKVILNKFSVKCNDNFKHK